MELGWYWKISSGWELRSTFDEKVAGMKANLAGGRKHGCAGFVVQVAGSSGVQQARSVMSGD